jgi:uncharacterized protein YsxB (DUF464 family)
MIKISVAMNSGDMVIDVKGHAGYAPHGHDIVCAAVSAILQTAVLGLESVAQSYSGHVEVDIQGFDQPPKTVEDGQPT